MKKNWKKSIKIGVSLLLVLCTVFSSFTVAFAAEDKGTIKYVSLGDSMTNGYGMSTGYTNENQGFQNTAADIYPVQFKEYLEEQGYTVDFYQYAMSAMRAEEIRFMFNLPENWKSTLPLVGSFRDLQAQWEEAFEYGDVWTYTQFTGFQKRFPTMFGDPDALAAGMMGSYNDLVNWVLTGTETAAATYMAAVKDADLISMAYGNAGMGAFCMQYINDALDDFGDIPNLKAELNFERTLSQLDNPELTSTILSLQTEIEAKLKSALSGYIGEDIAEFVNYLIYIYTYAIMSHVVNYTGALGDIAKVNEKDSLEIITLTLLNTFSGVELYVNENVILSLEDLFGLILKPVNDYMKNLPTTLKLQDPELYGNITFYFTEDAQSIDCVVNHFDEIKTNDIMRQRVHTEIVGSDGSPATMWRVLKTPLEAIGLSLPYVSIDEVRAYESDPSSLSTDKQFACAVYLGYEAGIVGSTSIPYITIDSLLGLADVEGQFGPLVEALVTPVSNWTSGTGDLAAITETMEYVLTTDAGLNSLCNLYARFRIGNGMGKHPSAEGHQVMAQMVIEAYDAEDSTFMSILKTIFNVFLKIWQKILGLFK